MHNLHNGKLRDIQITQKFGQMKPKFMIKDETLISYIPSLYIMWDNSLFLFLAHSLAHWHKAKVENRNDVDNKAEKLAYKPWFCYNCHRVLKALG